MLIHCSNRRRAHAGLLAVGGSVSGLEGSCRFMSGVGRVRAGHFPILDFDACIGTRFLAVFAE